MLFTNPMEVVKIRLQVAGDILGRSQCRVLFTNPMGFRLSRSCVLQVAGEMAEGTRTGTVGVIGVGCYIRYVCVESLYDI